MKRFLSHPSRIALLLFFCLALSPLLSHAAENKTWVHEVRIGLLDHDTDNLWSGSSREAGVDVNAELIFTPKYELWHGRIRPNLGLSVNSQGDTSKVYAGGVWQFLWKNGFILDLGAGLAVHDGEIENPEAVDKKKLGSRILLHFAVELGYSLSAHSRVFLMSDHISNGYTADPNEGLDTVGIRYGYLF
ncbi:MAG: acyloxyacyl hydrolase [Desulfoprunum sp.]|nr:acyloxyacyl hydrolase [Desulfoprunum sp.]